VKPEVAAELVNGRVMVPLRFIAEAFQMNVEYDNDMCAIIIDDDVNMDDIGLSRRNSNLSVSISEVPSSLYLTSEGTLDWAHWGLTDAVSFNHKSGVAQQISNYSKLGGNIMVESADSTMECIWADGTPNINATNTTKSICAPQVGNGFQLTVPADTNQKTLKLYVGAWRAKGKIEAILSDGSSSSYTGYIDSPNGASFKAVAINFRALSAGQTLTIRYTADATYETSFGNVILQAATLR
jgi:hypothetical protein